ncbi:GNAT family N-acetyltransferase [Candidatus Gracilibacteria bacterium]|nr:GNAT family N-acetyltransferase [Candidatus Gracilibacteria bacterium]MCF7856410.1 GNAT family N-acetyltransferase [Candidatus Gracilibacteria bacterium]MCF7896283.1 GNAT family N-acetyltransferase [Candidatus Gracilibacteria bacterium]
MNKKFQIDKENFQLTTFNRETFLSEKFYEVRQAMNLIRHEIESTFGNEDLSICELINAWQTFLIHDTRGKLAAWAAIHHNDYAGKLSYGVSSYVVLPEFRQKGLATFLARKMIEFCWESNKVTTAQFNITWSAEYSRETLCKACQQLGIEWSSVKKIAGSLASEMSAFRIPSRN